MSNSQFICFKCGLPVHGWRDTWKHASGGANGRTPLHRRHVPQPVRRTVYEYMYAIDTPVDEARALIEKYREQFSRSAS